MGFNDPRNKNSTYSFNQNFFYQEKKRKTFTTENIKYVIFLAKRRFENFKLIKISWEKGCKMLDYNAAEWEHFQKMAEYVFTFWLKTFCNIT